jgi:uncharacterized membrane protein
MMENLVKWTVHGLEMAALATIVLGFCASVVMSIFVVMTNTEGRYITFRRNVARTILVALELLIAADILRSLVLELSLMSLAILAALVAIRTFLSFSIDVELDGCWPWERAKLSPCASPETRGPPVPHADNKFRDRANT